MSTLEQPEQSGRLKEWAAEFGITLSAEQVATFARYRTLLQTWNAHTNLTRIINDEDVDLRHFIDSLTCATVMGDLQGKSVIDVGTGAGFPGVPLKLIYPTMRLTLVESIGKKCRFLEELVALLELSDVTILPERAETIGQISRHRAKYDWAVARAVAPMPILVEYLLPLVKVGGTMLAQKGSSALQDSAESLSAIAKLGGDTPQYHPIHLPQHPETYYLITVKKIKPTPPSYPRRVGTPTKSPLI